MDHRSAARVPVTPFLAAAAVAVLLTFTLPARLFDRPTSLVLEDSGGRLLGAGIAADGQWRLPGRKVPSRFVRALVAFEDKRFWSHSGFDLAAFVRAAGQNLSAGTVVSGGSTLTMQVLRLARRSPTRSWTDKSVEALGAVLLELRAGKEGVLRLFAENAPFGGNVVGLEAAAWRYFGHSPDDLSWAEAALLAVLPNNPGVLRPDSHRDDLRAKRDRLLQRLADDGAFGSDSLAASLAEPLPLTAQSLPQKATHLLARVAQAQSSGRVRTTLDGDLQTAITQVADRHRSWLAGNAVENIAVLVEEVATGRVLAYVGNGSGAIPGGANDMVRAPRSTGSILKPLLYARMLETGELLPRQLVEDVPTRIAGFVPRNNVNVYSGALPAAEALARSLNIPAVRELQAYGVARFAADLKAYGLTTLWRNPDDYGLPLVLGGAEATLWDLTGVYAGLARRALGVDAAFYPPTVTGAHEPAAPGPEVSQGAAWLTLDAMKEVVRPGEEAGWRSFASSRRVAWKTGTSTQYKDAWAVGVTPDYVVGVWVGNADGVGRPELLGLTAAAPVLFEVFNRLPATGWFPTPWNDLQAVDTCAVSGYLAGPDCGEPVVTWLPRNAVPTEVCPFHQGLFLDASGKYQADSRVAAVSSLQRKVWFVLPPHVAPYYAATHWDYRPPPPLDPRIAGLTGALPFELVVPSPGANLIVPVDLGGQPGRFAATAHHQDSGARLYWSLDGEYLGMTEGTHVMALRPPAGRHVLSLVDGRGATLNRVFHISNESVTERSR